MRIHRCIQYSLICVCIGNLLHAHPLHYYWLNLWYDDTEIMGSASARDDTSIVKHLISKGYINSRDSNGIPPLHYAVYYRNHTTISILLQNGANPDMQLPGSHETPLILATIIGDITTVQNLIQRGADAHLSTAHGNTALAIALYKRFHQIAYALYTFSDIALPN